MTEAVGEKRDAIVPVCCFLGSSVTYGAATGGVSFVERVSRMLRERGITTPVLKEAVSGTTLADSAGAGNPVPSDPSYVSRLTRIGVPVRHLVVQLSTNDVTRGMPRGALTPEGNEEYDRSTTLGAMEYIVSYARRTWGCGVTFYTNPYFESEAYAGLVRDLYALAEKWGVGVIDFYGRQPPGALSSYMSDPIHPNARGYEWMADVFADYLAEKLSDEP